MFRRNGMNNYGILLREGFDCVPEGDRSRIEDNHRPIARAQGERLLRCR